eukprot:GDKJ01028695.1.p1 GENE.GDKJ01028695.1~~GDKJ01028695.1.p1  ORF type:complete len:705 (-),score=196.45 GDKJ01028695.1:112-2226(-)
MASQLREIVERLNAEPFNKKLTVVSFDEKYGVDLVSILGDVLHALDKSKKFTVTEETIENTAARMNEVVGMLGYDGNRFSIGAGLLEKRIMNGDKDVIHSILHFLLTNFEDLKKKAYLAEFLTPIDVPADRLADDPSLIDALKTLQALQAEFQRAHDAWEQRQTTSANLKELKERLSQDEDDKERLQQQIEEKNNQTIGTPLFADIFKETSALRKEQELEAELEERLRQCHDEYGQNAQRCLKVRERRDQIRSQLSSSSDQFDVMVSIIRNEMLRSADMVESMKLRIEEYKEHIQDHEDMIRSPAVSTKQLEEMEERVKQLRTECEQMEKNIRSKDQISPNLKNFFDHFKNKEEDLNELMVDVQDRKRQVESIAREVKNVEQEFFAKFRRPFFPEEEYQKFLNELRQMRDENRELKTTLESINSEVSVLQRTEQLLTSQNQQLQRETSRMEEARGVVGYENQERKLENISISKNTSDASKHSTLQEMSAVVQELHFKLAEKAELLRPMTDRIKNLKEQIAVAEREVASKKNDRDQEQRKHKNTELEKQVSALQQSQSSLESSMFTMNIEKTIAETVKQRIDVENRQISGTSRFSAAHATLHSVLEQTVVDLERNANILKEQHHQIQQSSTRLVKQKKNLEGVKLMLQTKSAIYNGNSGSSPMMMVHVLNNKMNGSGMNSSQQQQVQSYSRNAMNRNVDRITIDH